MGKVTTIILLSLFLILSVIYYQVPLDYIESSSMFLSIATFLFATFSGFFISRQSQRFSSIRNLITTYDGNLTAIYRLLGHLSKNVQKETKKVITKHYETLIKKRAWDFYFINKTSTLKSLHKLIEDEAQGVAYKDLQHLSIQQSLVGLQKMQELRKSLIALHKERIPVFQWFLILLLAILLLFTVSIIPSQFSLLESLLKAAFSSSIISVIILIYGLNKLTFFEKTIGKSSAQDVLDIINDRK